MTSCDWILHSWKVFPIIGLWLWDDGERVNTKTVKEVMMSRERERGETQLSSADQEREKIALGN